ncbi:hypothetical protein M404DRAFT_998987 [Pisolithus tinctorius Marx 270]|uniref:Uncharacterized protein n=1 Tax=Pisolithus tinctorius Marx 270 TaxID=870435 RepID=A0A0C3PDY0_PISTI|nr:hypothetical protein M404DRAFT_998987 [Pisolithus tinctorius Marx 270]
MRCVDYWYIWTEEHLDMLIWMSCDEGSRSHVNCRCDSSLRGRKRRAIALLRCGAQEKASTKASWRPHASMKLRKSG